MDWNSLPQVIAYVDKFRAGILQALANAPTLTLQQQASLRPKSLAGPHWVSKFDIPPPPEQDVKNLLFKAIDAVNDGYGEYNHPDMGPIQGLWLGHSSETNSNERLATLSEVEKYAAMMKDITTPVVVLYVYGGSFCTNEPASRLKVFSKLAQMTGGRVYAVNQRLAPQNPFPAALLDVFLGYLSLLSPPSGSVHEAVPASSIIFAGDSSGMTIVLGLIQVLLIIQKRGWAPNVPFYGKNVKLAIPAGVTGISAVAELTNSLPSHRANNYLDVFLGDIPPWSLPDFPSCEIWPTKPPRAHIYCEASMLAHPIVSPAASSEWSGSPPLWFASGQEQILDSVRVVTQVAAEQGVPVVLKEYEALLHCFPIVFRDSAQAAKVWEEWADVCKALVSGEQLQSRAARVRVRGLKEQEVPFDQLTSLTLEDVRILMRQATRRLPIYRGKKGEKVARL